MERITVVTQMALRILSDTRLVENGGIIERKIAMVDTTADTMRPEEVCRLEGRNLTGGG